MKVVSLNRADECIHPLLVYINKQYVPRIVAQRTTLEKTSVFSGCLFQAEHYCLNIKTSTKIYLEVCVQ